MSGTVSKYFADKGYGFISGKDGVRYFFHVSQVNDPSSMEEGCRVRFRPMKMKRAFRAHEVLILKEQGPVYIEVGTMTLRVRDISSCRLWTETIQERVRVPHRKDAFYKAMKAVDLVFTIEAVVTGWGPPKVLDYEEDDVYYYTVETKASTYHMMEVVTRQGHTYSFCERDYPDIVEKHRVLSSILRRRTDP